MQCDFCNSVENFFRISKDSRKTKLLIVLFEAKDVVFAVVFSVFWDEMLLVKGDTSLEQLLASHTRNIGKCTKKTQLNIDNFGPNYPKVLEQFVQF